MVNLKQHDVICIGDKYKWLFLKGKFFWIVHECLIKFKIYFGIKHFKKLTIYAYVTVLYLTIGEENLELYSVDQELQFMRFSESYVFTV